MREKIQRSQDNLAEVLESRCTEDLVPVFSMGPAILLSHYLHSQAPPAPEVPEDVVQRTPMEGACGVTETGKSTAGIKGYQCLIMQ